MDAKEARMVTNSAAQERHDRTQTEARKNTAEAKEHLEAYIRYVDSVIRQASERGVGYVNPFSPNVTVELPGFKNLLTSLPEPYHGKVAAAIPLLTEHYISKGFICGMDDDPVFYSPLPENIKESARFRISW